MFFTFENTGIPLKKPKIVFCHPAYPTPLDQQTPRRIYIRLSREYRNERGASHCEDVTSCLGHAIRNGFWQILSFFGQ